MKEMFFWALKGAAMGTGNVIPGVSGGTIALITGIYERLINALKNLNPKAIRLFFTGQFTEFFQYIDFKFLASLFVGLAVSIFSLAKALEYLFEHYPVLLWAFFFGLIFASVFLVGKTINKWTWPVYLNLAIGAGIAIALATLSPASENNSTIFIVACGIVAFATMILPGLSGSFVLIIMGNYLLVLRAVSDFDFGVLIPLLVGCVIGMVVFSNLLSWVFKHYRDGTLALLTGFILGSLIIIWPWKTENHLLDEVGNAVLKDGFPILVGYSWQLPTAFNGEVALALVLAIIGFTSIFIMERFGSEVEI